VRARLAHSPSALDADTRTLAWFHLTNSYNSDGQWPPTLPDAPHIVHPFNYAYCFENLLQAEMLVGGIERNELETDPATTLSEILAPQQQLILHKAATMLASANAAEKVKAARARILIEKSQDVSSVRNSGARILYPSEYRVRAEALVEARQLVGGVLIEQLPTEAP
jgi:hypothetical protein